jgi:6-phosphogluconolactonase
MKFTEDSLFVAPTPVKLAEELAGWFSVQVNQPEFIDKPFYVAISGGSTPVLFFNILASDYGHRINWKKLHFFWVDERCVAPSNIESNYKLAFDNLFCKTNIPENNIHRINGENEAQTEAMRYGNEINSILDQKNGLPKFDLIILGLGDDGHTASFFPGQENLIHAENICKATANPKTGQKRITLTPRCINNATKIAFEITGMSKSSIVNEILMKLPNHTKYPAAHIKPSSGNLFWFLDAGAAKGLFGC